jgi:GxxExxY protein
VVNAKLKRDDLIYPELSYRIVGCAFEVFREIGSGHLEKHYQRALKITFDKNGIENREQVCHEIKLGDELIGKIFLDFVVDEKVVVEIKKDNKFSEANINQIYNYLKTSGLKLGLIINFGWQEVKVKRIINIGDNA